MCSGFYTGVYIGSVVFPPREVCCHRKVSDSQSSNATANTICGVFL